MNMARKVFEFVFAEQLVIDMHEQVSRLLSPFSDHAYLMIFQVYFFQNKPFLCIELCIVLFLFELESLLNQHVSLLSQIWFSGFLQLVLKLLTEGW